MPEQQCFPCSEKDTLERIEQTVNDMHRRLFVDNGGPSLTMQVDRNTRSLDRIDKEQHGKANKIWDFAKLVIAAAIALVGRWLILG